MIRIADKSQCCGCTACEAVCPHDAIVMKPDALGFMYPEADPAGCVECGLCDNVCNFVRPHLPLDASWKGMTVLAARNRSADALVDSQSGGVFSALSDVVLSQGGSVYGARMNDDFSVSHHRAVTEEERDLFRGSKYVQSDMSGVFRQVRQDLSQGKTVLFTGTPCQVAGLESYVPARFKENLILVDFICHGVPSPAVWKDYVGQMGKKGNLIKVCFRDKEIQGWKVHNESFRFDDGRKMVRETFRVLYYKNIMLRHSCAVCPYHAENRYADITLADFWGVGEVMPQFDGDCGTSMMFAHTSKGEKVLDKAMAALDTAKVTLSRDFVERKNPNLIRPTRIYKDRELFEKKYSEKGFKYVARRWGDQGWRYKAWQFKMFFKRVIGIK